MSNLTAFQEKHEKILLPLLRRSNNRITGELKTAENIRDRIRQAINIPESLVYKLREMDRLKTDLPKIRKINSRMSVSMTSLTMRTDELQAELLDLRKERDRYQREYSETLQNRKRVSSLRSKIMPAPKLKKLKAELTRNSAELRDISKKLGLLEKELPPVVQEEGRLKEELGQILKKIPLTREHITSMKEKIDKLSPKVPTEDRIKGLEKEVVSLRSEKEEMTEENRELSPRVAKINEEHESLTSILEGYRSRNDKDEGELSKLRKISEEMDVSEDKMVALKEQTAAAKQGLQSKSGELEKLKKDYSLLIGSRQKYTSVIEEVEEGTDQLQKMLEKRK